MTKRVLIVVGLSLASVMAFQYFTQKGNGSGQPTGASGDIQTGQFYSAPVKQEYPYEINREIDFIDADVDGAKKEVEQSVFAETKLYSAHFSNFGAVLKNLSFKEHKGKSGEALTTVSQDAITEKEIGCCLLALGSKTPYLYQLVEHKKGEGVQEIVYKATTDGWAIRKTFVLREGSYKIDVKLDFEPITAEIKPLSPRILFPAPSVAELSDDAMSGFVIKGDGKSVEKIAQSTELAGAWGKPTIFGAEDKYFANALVKDEQGFARAGFYKRENNRLMAILDGQQVKEKKSYELSFYFGPKLLNDLSSVDERLEDLLSFGWLSWLCKLLLKLLEFLFGYMGNFGLAIIVLTILLKLPFLPLSISSRRKMEEYQRYQPTINRIREKYRHDLQKQQEEIMLFHKDHNISPTTPMVGCLPLLIQMPILFALYRILNSYLSLYQAPFFGWIHDLSAKDPYYVLPILMGVSMLVQQLMTPVSDEKQRIMMMFMPVLMTAVFINFSAGLVLYWLMNNVLQLGEDLFRKKVLR